MLVVNFYPTEYSEWQALYPVVRIGSPQSPDPQASVAPPPRVHGGRHTRLRGMGEPTIPTKGQTLWYSMYNIISALRYVTTHELTVLQAGLCKIFNDVLLGYFLHEAGAGMLEQSMHGARNRLGTELSYRPVRQFYSCSVPSPHRLF